MDQGGVFIRWTYCGTGGELFPLSRPPSLTEFFFTHPEVIIFLIAQGLYVWVLTPAWVMVSMQSFEKDYRHIIKLKMTLADSIKFIPRLCVIGLLISGCRFALSLIQDYITKNISNNQIIISFLLELIFLILFFCLLYLGAVMVFLDVGLIEGSKKSVRNAIDHMEIIIAVIFSVIFLELLLMTIFTEFGRFLTNNFELVYIYVWEITEESSISFNVMSMIKESLVLDLLALYVLVVLGWEYRRHCNRILIRKKKFAQRKYDPQKKSC